MSGSATLIVFAGLPAAGKSTLARRLAREMRAVFLRIDTIEQSIRDAGFGGGDMGPMGYAAAYNVARDNLALGHTVVADSVNPLAVTRDAWRRVARRAGVPIIEVEVVCSDRAEHRRRVETRPSDVAGLVLPTWQEVVDREYAQWDRERVVIDTAGRDVEESSSELRAKLVNAGAT